ncbi:glycosyltransferase family 4 protein [Asticcacaulis solisilvae]|uniref:glycosyltransferase family 4 protein n=1 Tax=Asticcacaulis solisilvae TaxID=1217274 RepID=UPI003FD73BB8
MTQPRPLNIVLLLPSYFPDTVGGAEQHTRILAIAFQRLGHTATLIAPTQTPGAAGETVEDGVKVVRIATKQPPFLGGKKLPSLIHWWRQVYRYLFDRRDQIDVVAIQHLRLHSIPGVRFAKAFGKIVSGKLGRGGEHFDLKLLRGKKLPMGKWLADTIRASDMLYIANSADIVDDLVKEGAKAGNIVRLPNGVECPPASMAAFTGPDGTRNFTFAGRLEHEKGIVKLVEAFERIAKRHPDARLNIFGGGPLKDMLKDRVTAAGLSEIIRLHGVESDKARIFGGNAWFLLPSDSEGMSNALLEAMAHGVVPIITPVSGAADLVDTGRSGFIVADNQPDTLEAAIETALSQSADQWQSLSTATRNTILERFSIDEVARAYIELYQSRLGQADPSETPMAKAV